ncbi:MAG TPA: hypothetical protein PLJ43_09965, partial [Chitinophagales bacterium]|nr:hypothetical protein [Chitinophagales bacterium]
MAALIWVGCSTGKAGSTAQVSVPNNDSLLRYPAEKHLKNIHQLTYGGDNAEGYWSFNSEMLVFQRRNMNEGVPCDQIYYGKVPT